MSSEFSLGVNHFLTTVIGVTDALLHHRWDKNPRNLKESNNKTDEKKKTNENEKSFAQKGDDIWCLRWELLIWVRSGNRDFPEFKFLLISEFRIETEKDSRIGIPIIFRKCFGFEGIFYS